MLSNISTVILLHYIFCQSDKSGLKKLQAGVCTDDSVYYTPSHKFEKVKPRDMVEVLGADFGGRFS